MPGMRGMSRIRGFPETPGMPGMREMPRIIGNTAMINNSWNA